MRQTLLASAALALAAAPLAAESIRFASFNASMNRNNAGELRAALESGTDPQIQAVAEIIQRVNPDVLLVNEFDYDPANPGLFVRNYLNLGQNASGTGPVAPVDYPHTFIAPSNTGVASGHDLDNDGTIDGGGDAYGFGTFEGQFGMAVFSKYEIDAAAARTFQNFRWKDLPGARLPADPADADLDGAFDAWYTPAELDDVRLSSKSHWDLPIVTPDGTVHFLVSHPTPPVFDGPEDRNGLRNADEIRFWAEYVDGGDVFYDDAGGTGGLPPGARFVIAGDLNSDPFDGDSVAGAAQQLLDHPAINGSATDPSVTPASAGGPDQAAAQGGTNAAHAGDPAFDTADFGFAGAGAPDGIPGNLRVDYVLPSVSGLIYTDGGVFWPASSDPLFGLAAFPTSDHRLVWVDVEVTAPIPLPGSALMLAGALAGLGGLRLWRRRP
ncbi:MAG: endonuclease/exonuclease/phosphatase family protein [Pseudomonadota bacterium]